LPRASAREQLAAYPCAAWAAGCAACAVVAGWVDVVGDYAHVRLGGWFWRLSNGAFSCALIREREEELGERAEVEIAACDRLYNDRWVLYYDDDDDEGDEGDAGIRRHLREVDCIIRCICNKKHWHNTRTSLNEHSTTIQCSRTRPFHYHTLIKKRILHCDKY